jgi:hypothetical protein
MGREFLIRSGLNQKTTWVRNGIRQFQNQLYLPRISETKVQAII